MPKTTEDVDRTLGQADGFRRESEPRVREGCQFRRLDDTGISRRQRRGQAARCHFNRVVPRNDLSGNSHGFVTRKIEIPIPH